MTMLRITDIEQAINYFRDQHPVNNDDPAICDEVRVLADVYAVMIYRHLDEIEFDSLSARQLSAIQSYIAASAQLESEPAEQIEGPTNHV